VTDADRALWMHLGERLAAADQEKFDEIVVKLGPAVDAAEKSAFMRTALRDMADKFRALAEDDGGPEGAA
jgi:hypothetical protein